MVCALFVDFYQAYDSIIKHIILGYGGTMSKDETGAIGENDYI